MQTSSDGEYCRYRFSQRDKQSFRQQIHAASHNDHPGKRPPRDACWKSFVDINVGELCDIVRSRMAVVRRILQMATDADWSLPRLDRKRVRETFLYLQLRPDRHVTSMEAALLQAGAIDLLEQDCHTEMQLFDEFCAFRNAAAREGKTADCGRSEWLKRKRSEMGNYSNRRFLGMRRSKLFNRR